MSPNMRARFSLVEYFTGLKEGLSKPTLALLVLSVMILAAIITPVGKANDLIIQLNPSQGPVGTTVSYTGVGFTTGGLIEISFDSKSVAKTGAGMFGRINGAFTVPSVSPGTYAVTVTDVAGGYATATFTVTQKSSTTAPSTSTIWLSSTQGPKGTMVSVTGSGFNSGGSVSINFGTTNVASTSADASGGISSLFTIPSVSPGTYSVTATGAGGRYAAATFIVTQAISTGPSGLYPTQGSVGARAEFWSPLVIVVIVVVIAFIFLMIFAYRRRGKQETLPDEERPPYKRELSAPSKKPTVTSRTTQPASYSQQPPNTKICPHCKQIVKDDYNVCPYCRKRLR